MSALLNIFSPIDCSFTVKHMRCCSEEICARKLPESLYMTLDNEKSGLSGWTTIFFSYDQCIFKKLAYLRGILHKCRLEDGYRECTYPGRALPVTEFLREMVREEEGDATDHKTDEISNIDEPPGEYSLAARAGIVSQCRIRRSIWRPAAAPAGSFRFRFDRAEYKHDQQVDGRYDQAGLNADRDLRTTDGYRSDVEFDLILRCLSEEHQTGHHGAVDQDEAAGATLHAGEWIVGRSLHHGKPDVIVHQVFPRLGPEQVLDVAQLVGAGRQYGAVDLKTYSSVSLPNCARAGPVVLNFLVLILPLQCGSHTIHPQSRFLFWLAK